MQKIRQACKLIHVRLTKVNYIISCLLIIKKVMILNILIQEDTRIQMRCRWLFLSATALISDSIVIAQYHKNQWDQRWKNYRKCIANINVILTQRLHLFNKMMKMRDDFQKAESILATYIKTECIDLNAYLHFRNVSDMIFFFFIKCMQSMTMILSKRCVYIKLHVI